MMDQAGTEIEWVNSICFRHNCSHYALMKDCDGHLGGKACSHITSHITDGAAHGHHTHVQGTNLNYECLAFPVWNPVERWEQNWPSQPAIVLSGVGLCSSPLPSCRLTLTHDQISDITRPALPNSVFLSHSWKPCSNGISSKYCLPSLTGIVGSLIFYIFLFIISH